MTPRSVNGATSRVDFAHQLAERNQSGFATQKNKLRASVPKGSNFAQGYVDRAKTRQEAEEDERAARIQELDEQLKEEKIDRETYDRLRSEIAGGDLGSTHLVKGLDFKLLDRIRKGEDIYSETSLKEEDRYEDSQEETEDADDVLEQLESAKVKAVEREKTKKKGQYATTTLNPGQKRSRNQILAELKAMKAATAKAKEESSLGSKFKKIGAKQAPGTRIERDSKGREVMIIVDEDGHERRKVRKVDMAEAEERQREEAACMSREVLGMEVPEFYRKQQAENGAEEEDKEPNIFDDAGSDYDPLAGLESEPDLSDEEGNPTERAVEKKLGSEMAPPPKRSAPSAQNYFKDSKTGLTSEETYKSKTLAVDDPVFLAALKKAKAASAAEKSEEEKRAAEREERLKKKLLENRRDDDDLDMGFGSSRLEDEADLEETKVKLSAWGDEDDADSGGNGKEKRKKGPKKKKGDKNNFADVMKVIERNKGSN